MQATTTECSLLISTNVMMNVCSAYLSACITTINDDNSKGINAQLTSYADFGIHEIRVGQIHRRPTRPKIRVGLVLHVLHGSGAYAYCVVKATLDQLTRCTPRPCFQGSTSKQRQPWVSYYRASKVYADFNSKPLMRSWDHLSYGITQCYLTPDRGDIYRPLTSFTASDLHPVSQYTPTTRTL